jgi:uncharacterized protein (UPF0332 family)
VESGRIYQRARRQRDEADYGENVTIDEAASQQTILDAERFANRLETFLREHGTI